VQISLGKAEVKDKFEEAKKQMKKSVQEFKGDLSSERKQTADWGDSIKVKLNELDDQLAKGRAETKLIFEEQKKNILKGIEDLKADIKKNPEAVKLASYFTAASEKIKLKLELFEKKMGVGKTELTKEFKDEMNNAREKINSIIAKTKDKKDDIDLKMEKFSDEIHIAYNHLKKAVKAL